MWCVVALVFSATPAADLIVEEASGVSPTQRTSIEAAVRRAIASRDTSNVVGLSLKIFGTSSLVRVVLNVRTLGEAPKTAYADVPHDGPYDVDLMVERLLPARALTIVPPTSLAARSSPSVGIYALLGAGVLSSIASAIFGVLASRAHDEWRDPGFGDDLPSRRATYQNRLRMTGVFLGTGVVCIASGLLWYGLSANGPSSE